MAEVGGDEEEEEKENKMAMETKVAARSSLFDSIKGCSLPGYRIDKAELKHRILIPEYLRLGMRDAIRSKDLDAGNRYPRDDKSKAPEAPLVVFVNSKSGGRHGPELKKRLQELMGEEQVFDLSVVKPPEFVQYGLACLEKLASLGDHCAKETREKMRIMVAGGDGTVGWVLGSLAELYRQKREPVPPTGIIPLGTGNDLSRSFSWGGSFPFAWRAAIKRSLCNAISGPICHLDSWQVLVSMPSGDNVALPHCMRHTEGCSLEQGFAVDGELPKKPTFFEGVFYNYYSIGMDAQVAYGFHHLRDKKPHLAQGPVTNKGNRKYSPLQQPSAQQVMVDTISKGPTTVFVIGAHTNFAIFLMTNPHLKKNVEHIYVMGGGVRSENPTGCCPKNSSSSCTARQCGDHGNLFTSYSSNPYAEFNVFGDPFAAYQVVHSGIPITLVPLDATNTIPIAEEFFDAFERRQTTYEAQYTFQSLKMARDTWFDNQFYTSYFMWDSFTSGVASSIMGKLDNIDGQNEFAEMEYMNITVVTSNKPYGISDGSNPFFDGRETPKFNLEKGGVHSGHVQIGVSDPFCLVKNGKGRCQDGYTKEVAGPEGVRVLVATKAKPSSDNHDKLDRAFFKNFLDVLNFRQHTGRFNFTTEFPYYKQVTYKPDFGTKRLGKPVVFDMDMSAGDFLALIYLLKVPVEVINLKGILVSATGWANAGTIDVIYDVLHMMGRDDIPVGRGEVYAMGQPNPSFSSVGDCKYIKAIPNGAGGLLDSDTLYGFARNLPRSPRRYTAENSVKFGAPRDTDHPEMRQPLALEVWQSIAKSLDPGSKITILTNGPLSNLAQIILSEKNLSSVVEELYIVGGHINHGNMDKGNIFTVPENKYAEFNMFLDPLAAKTVLDSQLKITLIPLGTQRGLCSFSTMIGMLRVIQKTPEAIFAHQLLSRIYRLQQKNHRYQHTDTFLGEIIGSVLLSADHSLRPSWRFENVTILATGFFWK